MKKDKKKEKNSFSKAKKPNVLQASRLKLWPLILCVVALVVLGGYILTFESGFIFRAQELNLFLYTSLFFKQCMVVSGGFLTWLGSYFTQFFYHPWMGTLLLCVWWALLAFIVKKTFNIPDKWAVVLLIPIALLALTDFTLGYWLFYLKMRGHFFASTIGFTAAVAMIWLYRSMPTKYYLQPVTIFLSVLLLYPIIGFYSLLAALGMGIISWKIEGKTTSQRIIDSVIAILSIIAIPLFYYRFVFYETNIINIYWTGLPLFRIDKTYYQYYIPYYLLVTFVVVAAACYSKKRNKDVTKVMLWGLAQCGLLLVIAGLTYHFWYKDENYHKELVMNRCAENLDWDGILNIAQDTDEPTRMIWMLKNLALFRQGQQGDKMYHYKNGDKKCAAPFTVRMTQTGGKTLYLNYGQVNFCYRWCLEDGVEYGWRVDYYKFMLKCSLLNGELAVAQKYIDILKKTKYYKDWAMHYESYVKNPELIKKDKEFEPILHMMKADDVLASDNTLIEIYLLNIFANSDGDDPLYQEQTLLAALQMKDIQMFWPRFFHYAQLHQGQHMPIHYQEAAYLYGHLENQVDISHMPFDKEVVDSYNEFMSAAQQYGGMSEEQMKPMMYNRFGGTFYYEYFFTRNQKSY